jgi:hypothetical protein
MSQNKRVSERNIVYVVFVLLPLFRGFRLMQSHIQNGGGGGGGIVACSLATGKDLVLPF